MLPAAPYLLNIFHHNTLDFRNLSLHFRKLAYFFRMIHTVLHVLLQFGPIKWTKESKYAWKKQSYISIK